VTDSRPASGILRFLLVTAGVVACVLMVFAAPADASNLTATDGRATVLRIEPAGAVTVGVIGGDAALRVVASPAHEVIVLGYQQEPYLRIAADGSTSVNMRSPARSLNRSRTGGAEVGTTDASAPAEWVPLDSSGEVVWHDHRIHAMTAAETGHPWTISLLVDGQPVTVSGELRIEPSPSVLPWALLIAALVALGVLLGRHRPVRAALITAGIAAVISLVLAALITLATPDQLGRDLLPVLLSVGAWLACALGWMTRYRIRLVATIASAALSAGVLATMLGGLTSAVPMPILGPPVLDRLALSLAVAAVLASIVLVVIGAGRPEHPPVSSAPPSGG
jgi:hypothetical protein